ncbi:FAD-binding protein [Halobellus captivus]|uniref:FAD-binding protein n=1 Tax=Halobellus captivus TaxID=2592614 RepID=UPI0011A72D68|nr:FAD-binding protein [Halobellus captivus]
MSTDSIQSDVVVAGSGLAGLVSTVRALEVGATVTLLEKGHRLGGTLPVTGGTFAVDNDADPAIEAHEPIEDSLSWLEEIGIPVHEPQHQWLMKHIKRVGSIEPEEFITGMRAIIESKGGDIYLETPLEEISTNTAGEVDGVHAYNSESGRITIETPSVILATGGIVGNEELVERYFGNADILLTRQYWSTGDGFLAAQKLGAKTTKGLTDPVGHSMPGRPAEIGYDDLRAAQMYETEGIAIDSTGKRFTNEAKYESGSVSFINDLIEKPDGDVFLIIDQELYDTKTNQLSDAPTNGSRLEQARKLGAPVLEADSIEALGDKLSAVGVHGQRAVETITEFNEAMRTDTADSLEPRRTNLLAPIDEPPFYAVGVRPGLVLVRGGLDIDERARVLGRARSTSTLDLEPTHEKEWMREPILGLYAAGVEVGRPSTHSYYHLGYSLGLATGRIAGSAAAEYALQRRTD